jgi:hypothetical protein
LRDPCRLTIDKKGFGEIIVIHWRRSGGDGSYRREEPAGEEQGGFFDQVEVFEKLLRFPKRFIRTPRIKRTCQSSSISEEIHQDLEDKKNLSEFFDFQRGSSGLRG